MGSIIILIRIIGKKKDGGQKECLLPFLSDKLNYDFIWS